MHVFPRSAPVARAVVHVGAALILLLALAGLAAPPSARAQLPPPTTGGSVDPGFTPPTIGGNLDDDFNPAGSVQSVSIQQGDGKLLVGGSQIRGVVRLNPDGTQDTTFAVGAGADGTVSALVAQVDGSVLIGGDFTAVNGVPAPRLARLKPDGSIDPTFRPQVSGGPVRALALLPGGQLAVGGEFTQVAQAPARSLARLNADGSPDGTFNAALGADGPVYALAAHPDGSGRLLVGGAFNNVGGAERANLGQVNADGSADLSFDPDELPATAAHFSTRVIPRRVGKGTDGVVRALKFLKDGSGRALVGGSFGHIGTSAQAALALLLPNGKVDPRFQPGGATTSAASPAGATLRGISGPGGGTATVFAFDLQSDGKVVIGGAFSAIADAARNAVARLNTDGSVDRSYNPGSGANASVRAVTLQPDEKAVIAGSFSAVNNVPRGGVARLLPGDPSSTGGPTTVSVVGTPARAGFVFSRSGSVDAAVTVFYHNGGAAIRDQDYVAFPGSVTIPAGQSEVVLPVTLLPGANRNRKVKVFLDPSPDSGAYQIAKAQSKVFLSDL